MRTVVVKVHQDMVPHLFRPGPPVSVMSGLPADALFYHCWVDAGVMCLSFSTDTEGEEGETVAIVMQRSYVSPEVVASV